MATLTNEDIQLLNIFEKTTGAPATDLIRGGDFVVFFIAPGMVGKAIGKNRANIERMEKMLNTRIICVEDVDDPEAMARNFFHLPENRIFVEESGKKTLVIDVENGQRSAVIGRAGNRINSFKLVVKHKFNIDGIRLNTA